MLIVLTKQLQMQDVLCSPVRSVVASEIGASACHFCIIVSGFSMKDTFTVLAFSILA